MVGRMGGEVCGSDWMVVAIVAIFDPSGMRLRDPLEVTLYHPPSIGQ